MRATTITNHDWRYRFSSGRRQATSAGWSLLTTGAAGFDPAPRHRCAITLIEVLISMGILTIGLLSVAALFPVGGYYMRQGEIADRGAAIAQAAFADVVARGMLKAESWQMWEKEKDTFDQVRPQFVAAAPTRRDSFTRPVTSSIRIMLQEKRKDLIEQAIGSTFVLDPLGAASVSVSSPHQWLERASKFPATTYKRPGSAPEWQPWGDTWPVRRITTAGLTSDIFPSTLADSLLSSHDDLVTEPPGTSNSAGIQQWESTASGPLKRSWKGDYSWIVTICPSNPEARDAIGLDPSAHKYHISVVVFHKRVVATSTPQSVDDAFENLSTLTEGERVARGRILSRSSGGGEIILERLAGDGFPPDQKIFVDVKPGQWLMLSGPHPSSPLQRPMFFSRWYRVLAVEGKNTQLNADGSVNLSPSNRDPERRLVTLRGPAWLWDQATDMDDNTLLSNDLRVGIFPSAVAVHSRTMRLESGVGNNQ